MISVSHGCKVACANGEFEMNAASAVKEATVLLVNGTTYISKDSGEAIASYEKIIINGTVYAPEGIKGLMSGVQLNGSIRYYPNSFQLVKGNLHVDKIFLLRAKQGGEYFITGNLTILDDSLNPDDLLSKNPRFIANKAYVGSAHEDAVALIADMTPVELIPEGYRLCESCLRLNDTTALQYGKSIYVLGDLIADHGSRTHLDALENLIVSGCVKIPEGDRAAYLEKVRKYGSLTLYRGTLAGDGGNMSVTPEWLAEYADGVTIENCGTVEIDPGVEIDLIRKKIHVIRDCGSVMCSAEQLGAIQKVSEECGHVGVRQEKKEPENDNIIRINTATYAL